VVSDEEDRKTVGQDDRFRHPTSEPVLLSFCHPVILSS
jgi:hypothetical protein